MSTEWSVLFDDGHRMVFTEENVARRVAGRAAKNGRATEIQRRTVSCWSTDPKLFSRRKPAGANQRSSGCSS